MYIYYTCACGFPIAWLCHWSQPSEFIMHYFCRGHAVSTGIDGEPIVSINRNFKYCAQHSRKFFTEWCWCKQSCQVFPFLPYAAKPTSILSWWFGHGFYCEDVVRGTRARFNVNDTEFDVRIMSSVNDPRGSGHFRTIIRKNLRKSWRMHKQCVSGPFSSSKKGLGTRLIHAVQAYRKLISLSWFTNLWYFLSKVLLGP